MEAQTNALKPCPFCGGNPEWFYCSTSRYPYIQLVKISCSTCGGSTKVFSTEDRYGNKIGGEYDAVANWNRRMNDG